MDEGKRERMGDDLLFTLESKTDEEIDICP
jgi:hypothetical protein